MTNETLEQRMGVSKRLLIVEDKLGNIVNGYNAGIARGYEVDVACDLEDALKLISLNKYTGIITDMCFSERGINEDNENGYDLNSFYIDQLIGQRSYFERNGNITKDLIEEYVNGKKVMCTNSNKKDFIAAKETIDTLPTQVKQSYDRVLKKSAIEKETKYPGKSYSFELISYRGNTDKKLREEVTVASIKAMPYELAMTLKDSLIYNGLGSPERFKEFISSMNSENSSNRLRNPALGYFVALAAKERNIPVSIISSTNHADHAVPAAMATGLITSDQFGRVTKKSYNIGKLYVFDKVIFTSEKSLEVYTMGIDQIEGKNEITRLDTSISVNSKVEEKLSEQVINDVLLNQVSIPSKVKSKVEEIAPTKKRISLLERLFGGKK